MKKIGTIGSGFIVRTILSKVAVTDGMECRAVYSRSYETVTADMQRWFDEVGSLVGDVSVLFYPFGGRLDGDDVRQNGPAFLWMQEHGFRIFCSVGIESWSKSKGDISAVICDRLHPDGTTLRGSDKVLGWYSQFYDARDIIDLEARPQREVRWTPKA